jgi:hypothetical protein
MVACATTALAQVAEPGLPPGVEWAVSPASILAKTGWGRSGTQAEAGKGVAVVKCGYDARGLIGKCQALNERPTGFALGAAAVSVAQRAKLKATLSDGSPLTAGTITVEVVFRDEDRSRLGGSSFSQQAGSARAQEAARNDRATRDQNR